MNKNTKEIIGAIFIVGWLILAVMGYWYLGFILAIVYLFILPKTDEEIAEKIEGKLLGHLLKKRDWSNKEQVKKDMEKELIEMKELSDKVEEKNKS